MPPYYLGICCALYIKVDVRLHLNDQYKELNRLNYGKIETQGAIMARIRTEEEKEAARQAAKQAKKDQWLREQEEKRPIHEKYMKDAIRQAKKAAALGEVPIGCVIVHDGQVIGSGYNRRNTDKSTLAHAEITAIKRASKQLGDWRLEDCTLYETLEP